MQSQITVCFFNFVTPENSTSKSIGMVNIQVMVFHINFIDKLYITNQTQIGSGNFFQNCLNRSFLNVQRQLYELNVEKKTRNNFGAFF